jgi:hypothetical protein
MLPIIDLIFAVEKDPSKLKMPQRVFFVRIATYFTATAHCVESSAAFCQTEPTAFPKGRRKNTSEQIISKFLYLIQM